MITGLVDHLAASQEAYRTGPSSYLFRTRVSLQRNVTFGALAQLGEHLLCKQGVIGSIPIRSTMELSTHPPDGSVAQVVRAHA